MHFQHILINFATRNDNPLRKIWKILRNTLLVLILLLVTVWSLIHVPAVQTWLVSRVTHRLSHDLHTTIRIKHVDFELFNKMLLDSTLVEDGRHDTLLYAATVRVNITDWFFFKDKAQLQYIGLDDATVKLQRTDSVWNYQFLVDYFTNPDKLSKEPDTTKSLQLDLKEVVLTNIHFLKHDAWRGEDMDLHLKAMHLDADTISFNDKIARVESLTFTQPDFILSNYDGNRPPLKEDTTHIINDPNHLRLNPDGWDITARSVKIRNGSFQHIERTDTTINPWFDGNHIHFSAVNTSFNDLRLNRDTLTAQLSLNTKERSGLEVKKLNARIRWYPEAMEFARLDLQTNRSHLHNFFAMRFKTLDDMSYFVSRIHMEGRFNDSEIDADDIAFFAPALRDWDKHVRLTGDIQGTVSDLHGRRVIVEAGKNTFLNADFHLKGLPDIEKTNIEFKSNDFRTTYEDMATLVPSLRKVEQVRLDRVAWLHYEGDFNGTIRDFVTKGTIETNLGALETNINMQLPAEGTSAYGGTIGTDSFYLGPFLDNDNLGHIAFQGNIKGTGLKTGTLSATLDGMIDNLEFNHYAYRHIQVNGAVAKRKFNGELIASDPNLDAHLNGLIDYSQKQPKFDFEAEVAKADLTRLHFVRQQVEFDGKFKCNFTGDNIDNFLGKASIYDASLFKNGQRVSFDSLTLESSIVDSNKTITVVSNEFDGAIVGQFSIHDLPASFQTFLNKYYPSYISPAKSVPANQNFSFVIDTKNVDEYIDLFIKDLRGFNNSGINGRIDTRKNLLDLNADVPQFGYKNIAFNHVFVRGRGNLDSLSMTDSIGQVFINDSLHFPGTRIHLSSMGDLTSLQVSTSASQTLNSANISARVQTMRTGVKVTFDPSTFEINSKIWHIDKDGQLAYENKYLSADGLNLRSGDQTIAVTTHPSGEGNWNDIHVDLTKVNIGDFTPYVVKSERLEGLLTGSADMTDPFGKHTITFKGQADQFRFANDSIGHLDLAADYEKATGAIHATLHSDNKNYHLDGSALINLDSTAAGPPIDITTDVADMKVSWLEKYLGGVFTNITGNVSGKLHITGPASHLYYLGTVNLRDASLKVAYTQCTYKIASATVVFKKDTIDFGTIQVKDRMGHTAELTRGRLFHHAFDDLGYDFEFNTNRLLLLDTKATDNNQFYGTVIGKARITLTGPDANMQMFIKGEPTDSSNIYLPPSISRESGEADFIKWRVYGKEMKEQAPEKQGSNLTVTLDMYANNYANIYMILDPLSGDVIKANGHGNLVMRVGTTEDLTLNGRYEIDRGLYNFTFQSFIHKPFVLKEGVGNYIQWTGDPYDATIGIQAVFTAENVRFSDLGLTNSSLDITDANVLRYRGNILVTANLTGKYNKPDIAFQIDLPPNSPLKNDQDAQTLLQRIQNDPNELNKQVSCLVVLNSFVPLSNSTNSFDASAAVGNVVVNSISGVISNAFSKQVYHLLQRVFNDKSLQVNFNTNFYNGNYLFTNIDQSNLAYNRTNLNFSIGKSFMNEKLTMTVGSALDFGLNQQQVQAASFQFLPDITAEYKITPDGRVALTFFYRDSYNYLNTANHTQNSSGTSISYRREFDNFAELFKKKKKRTPAPPPAAPPPPAQNITKTDTTPGDQ